MAVIPALTGFWRTPATLFITPTISEFTVTVSAEVGESISVTPAISEFSISSFIPAEEPPGGDDLPAGTYTFDTTGTTAAGGAGCGFTIFELFGLNTDSYTYTNNTVAIKQAGSTAIYRHGTDYTGGMAVDISATLNLLGQRGVYMIVPFDSESGTTRSYDGIGGYSGENEMVITSASPVEAAALAEWDIPSDFADYDGNLVSPAATGINFAIIIEPGSTVALGQS